MQASRTINNPSAALALSFLLALVETPAEGGRRRVGTAHPPAAGLRPAAGMFLWPGPSAPAIKTPPPSPSYREGCAGGGGVWRPRGGPAGRPSACQTKSAGRRQSLRPRAFQDASRPAAAPPGRWSFHRRQNGNAKPGPIISGAGRHKTVAGRGTAAVPSPRAKPGPTAYGPGRHNPPAAGYRPKPPTAAGARRSPCAQHPAAGYCPGLPSPAGARISLPA